MSEKRFLKEILESTSAYKYESIIAVLNKSPELVLEELKSAELTGRGGAAFPVYQKWMSVYEKENVVLICNGDEGEPGTFKDRYIMENRPELMLEGVFIGAYVLRAENIYIYIRGEYKNALYKVKKALKEAEKIIKLINSKSEKNININIVTGVGAYVCGDETSLINSIQGIRPNSRIKPPYPFEKGLRGRPTIVNNVETFSNIPLIIRDGGINYSKLGCGTSRGTKLVCLSGLVKRPGVYEVEFGMQTIREIIYNLGGGLKNNENLKFVIPGGVSTEVLNEKEIDVKYTHKDIKDAGSLLGSGAMIVAGESVDAVETACNVADFFMRETCGICFPCKEGNRQIHHLLNKIINGQGEERYLKLIEDITETTTLSARCGLGQSAGNLILSTIKKFRGDYMRYLI